jgi:hypothetical protein
MLLSVGLIFHSLCLVDLTGNSLCRNTVLECLDFLRCGRNELRTAALGGLDPDNPAGRGQGDPGGSGASLAWPPKHVRLELCAREDGTLTRSRVHQDAACCRTTVWGTLGDSESAG